MDDGPQNEVMDDNQQPENPTDLEQEEAMW